MRLTDKARQLRIIKKPRHQLFWKKHIRLTQYMITKKKVSSITEKQEQTLISYTQLDCEDRGYTLKYRGKDTWNVALNYINNKNRWIVTCNDVNYGRIKAIYEWDGEENSGATLIYLLVSGNELVNNLNN